MAGNAHQTDPTKLKGTVNQAEKDRTITGTVDVDGSGVTQPISATALPLPEGAATSAKQLANDHDVNVSNQISGFATSAKQLANDHDVNVTNQPSGFATSEKQLADGHSVSKGDTSYTKVHKDDQQTTAQTNTTLWDPTGGKKFVITDIIISVDTAMTVTLKDEAAVIFEFYFAANGGCVINLQTPYESTTADNILKYTTSTNGKTSITIEGYEV